MKRIRGNTTMQGLNDEGEEVCCEQARIPNLGTR